MATILLVDDHASIRMFCRQELEAASYRVVEAADGLQAVTEVTRQRPDVVVLDLRMPRMDGRETLKRIREIAPGVPVIFFTAHPEELAADTGAAACVPKSADLGGLLGAIRSVIAS